MMKNKDKIFFDLDGTLIDSRKRLYTLFSELVKESDLTFDKYWQLKRNKIGHKQILREYFSYSNEKITTFEQEWMGKIELPQMLLLDKPFDGIVNYLEKISEKNEIYLITARQHPDRVLFQIENLGLNMYFKEILVTQQKYEKSFLIKNRLKVSDSDWMVGDTGKDIQSGKELNLKTVAVLSGFMNREKLSEYNPDFIVNNIMEVDFELYSRQEIR